jgi:tRNA(His) guanylyltransferase
VVYPGIEEVKDYFKWRGVDSKSVHHSKETKLTFRSAHINNLYNTTFWALVQQGKMSAKEAHQELSVSSDRTSLSLGTDRHITIQGTFAKDKHEILFKRFEINYNQLPEQFRRGSTVVRIPPNTSVSCNL